jgi:heavy metal translocating P-type ATPase
MQLGPVDRGPVLRRVAYWTSVSERLQTRLLVGVTLAGIVAGGIAYFADYRTAADIAWIFTTVAAAVPVGISIVRELLRRNAGVDVIALMAMAGSIILGEYFAGAVIAVMVATGRALEEYAAARAERELSSLLKRAPRHAQRLEGTELVSIPVEEVRPGDTLVVREADVIPVDGVVSDGDALLDESALTGESRLVERAVGDALQSGAVNAGAVFQMRATATSEHSTFAGIIRLVEAAQKAKAPLVRLADRYAQFFIPTTLAIAGFAWAISGDPVRALAVLVVATPCPLLLAAPIAIVSGVSRSARRGIVVKGGGALETLARGEVVFVDKTGTLTAGTPRLERFVPFDAGVDEAEVLRLAASLDQMSSHTMAAAIVRAARTRGLSLSLPSSVVEAGGHGVSGVVDGHEVRVGVFDWVMEGCERNDQAVRFRRRMMRDGGAVVFVAADGRFVGAFLLDDPIRTESARSIRALKRLGIGEVVMLSGDHTTVAEAVGAALGVDRVIAECTPAEKVEAVTESRRARTTLMVGDGINDAPALAAADVGIAMGARGATSSSEAADVVLTVDRLDRLVEAITIAQRSRRIAIQSMVLGMGLSFVAMGFATFGYLTPVAGAILQEGIDVVAIMNALRALRNGRAERGVPVLPAERITELQSEHRSFSPSLERLRTLADGLGHLADADAHAALNETREFIDRTVVPHERDDELRVYPEIAGALGGDDPLAAMSRTHQEVFHLARKFDRLVSDLPPGKIEPEDLADLRRLLYALHAILLLNIAQEEELYTMFAAHE